VSGVGGSYIGLDYSTNNLLGYGETLSVSIATGNLQKVINLGFNEPYVKGRPISLGFNIFYQNYKFFGQGFGAITNANTFGDFSGQSLFTQKTEGATISSSAPLSYFAKRLRMGRFIRLGLSYSFRTTDILDPDVNTDNDPSNNILVTFRQSGVTQSTVTPSISYNTLNGSLDPTKGKSITLALSASGGPLGGKVQTIEPTLEFKMFRPLFAGRENTARLDPQKTRTFGFRALFSHIGSFGTPFQSNSLSFIGGTPLFARFFLGGEETIRGYSIRGISPTAPVFSTFTTQNVVAKDSLGHELKVKSPSSGHTGTVAPSVVELFEATDAVDPSVPPFPAFIGGDTQLLFNVEYRIPIIGPVSFAPFFDIGSVFNLQSLADQFERSEFLPNQPLGTVILNPRGERATPKELRKARPPESNDALPPGFTQAFFIGDRQTSRRAALSQTVAGVFDNYRYSLGGEIRVQVPVINVPFRLIFALNPNARTDNPFFFEQKKAIRFSVGRTF
jgi:outer membrane protein insertion porin family